MDGLSDHDASFDVEGLKARAGSLYVSAQQAWTARDRATLRTILGPVLYGKWDEQLREYESRGEELVVSKVADDEGWREVKETLIKNVGTNSIPVLKIEDADFGQNRTLYMKHSHDGRDLQLEYGEKTMAYLQKLWGREVVLETTLDGKRSLLCSNDRGFSVRTLK